jgi:hypothetical protein
MSSDRSPALCIGAKNRSDSFPSVEFNPRDYRLPFMTYKNLHHAYVEKSDFQTYGSL